MEQQKQPKSIDAVKKDIQNSVKPSENGDQGNNGNFRGRGRGFGSFRGGRGGPRGGGRGGMANVSSVGIMDDSRGSFDGGRGGRGGSRGGGRGRGGFDGKGFQQVIK